MLKLGYVILIIIVIIIIRSWLLLILTDCMLFLFENNMIFLDVDKMNIQSFIFFILLLLMIAEWAGAVNR